MSRPGSGFCAFAALLLVVLNARSGHAQQPLEAAPLQWLAGCWESRRGDVTIEEQWLAPRGGVLLGVSRTARRDSVIEYEYMRIYPRAGALVFAASPSGQAPAEFTESALTATEVLFENPAHDFPQRIRYRAQSPDSLIAEIEGDRQGTTRRIAFRYARTPCVPAPR
jgi:hypothetical protein